MLIGQLSKETGISRDTLRFYEKEGLIRSSLRENGYRDYASAVVEELKLIQLAKTLGFSLKEIKSLKVALLKGELSREKVRSQLEKKLLWIEQQSQGLKMMKKLILEKLNNCDTPIC
ncbi:MerR family transcriptional regulator [Bdellovibrio bacteriovorus]|uniref:MerR family transcriptional regulator n=1 Tax=Bdellovibrio bacteriovorus TaxID=959 RepID=UPI003AA95DF8